LRDEKGGAKDVRWPGNNYSMPVLRVPDKTTSVSLCAFAPLREIKFSRKGAKAQRKLKALRGGMPH
jgi:hypothetical protein